MNCPHCRQPLIRRNEPPHLLWICNKCGGCAATIANLRKGIQHAFLKQAWNQAIGANGCTLARCPGCSLLMNRVPMKGGPEIDLCRHCQMMWFDAGELAAIPKRAAGELAADKWEDELRQMQRRRTQSEFYRRLLRRRAHWSIGIA